MEKNIIIQHTEEGDSEYVKLVSHILELWNDARGKAIKAVNHSLLMANWATGQYIIEFEHAYVLP